MAIKGGYKIIDLEDKSIDTSSTAKIVVDDIYDRIEASYRKAILLSGIVIDGVEKNDCYVDVTLDSDDFVFTALGYNWTIADDDSVTIEAVEE